MDTHFSDHLLQQFSEFKETFPDLFSFLADRDSAIVEVLTALLGSPIGSDVGVRPRLTLFKELSDGVLHAPGEDCDHLLREDKNSLISYSPALRAKLYWLCKEGLFYIDVNLA